MTAALLGWAQATCASKIAMDAANTNKIDVTREVDGGLEQWSLRLPAVITVDLRLNTPRYASLPNIMKARRKPLEYLEPSTLGVTLTPQLTIGAVNEPRRRPPGIKVPDATALVAELQLRGVI